MENTRPMTAPTVDTTDDVGEDQKFNRLLNAFGKAYHDYIRSESKDLYAVGQRLDVTRDEVAAYVNAALLAARREVEATRAALRSVHAIANVSGDMGNPNSAIAKIEAISRPAAATQETR